MASKKPKAQSKTPLVEQSDKPLRVILLGATGTVGLATLDALLSRGHHIVCFVRARPNGDQTPPVCFQKKAYENTEFRFGDVTSFQSLENVGFRNENFDAVVSCLASRTGAPDDAWAIDYQAHANTLQAARKAGVKHMVLVSAICVQKPKLAFQHAKLAFEKELIESGLKYSIVRPTALFKSLSGQIERLRKGKSFLLFGDGRLTACKPISDRDLGNYIAQCLDDKNLHNQILPIGGPGPAITPKQQGAELFALLGRKPRYTHVPVAFLDVIIKCLSVASIVSPALARKAEFARIGRYYATESMLHFDPVLDVYDEAATPSTGFESLFQHYANIINSNGTVDLGKHSVF
jgi:divinyl chlorophyllide a 8-vinyl-reductase